MSHSGKVVGKIVSVSGHAHIADYDGTSRVAVPGAFVYENERVVSYDPNAAVQIKYLDIAEPLTYAHVFNVLMDSAVYAKLDSSENSFSEKTGNIDPLETAA